MAARFNPDIDRLCLYNRAQQLFSSYYRDGFQGRECQPAVDPQSLHLTAVVNERNVVLGLRLNFDNELTGYLQIQGNLDAVHNNQWRLYVILGATLLVSWLLSFLLAAPMLNKTLRPLDNLSEMALSFIGNPLSQARATVEGDDEVGDLVKVLNQMLDNLSRENCALLESESRFRTLADNSPIGIYFKDKDYKLIYANRQWLEMCGIESIQDYNKFYTRIHESDQRTYVHTMNQVANEGRSASVEYQCLVPESDKTRVLMEYIAPLFSDANNGDISDREPSGFIGSVMDISDLKSAQNELEKLAFNDPLTKLPNRRFFNDHLNFRMAAAKKEKRPLAIMMIDLDNFKRVNDSLGHDAGDKLLTVIAQRLRHEVFEEDVVSRMGGDEFVVLIESTCSPDLINQITQKILNVVSRPIGILHQGVEITCSIGVARFPDDASTPKDLLRNADIALYHAKSRGRNCLAYFSSALNNAVQERIRLEAKLRQAINNGALSLFIQPQYDTHSKGFVWGEVLLRWFDPDEGYIPPDKFIPVAEETGLIVRIGHWVFHEVCRILADHADGLNNLGIAGLSVNLSARQFYAKNLFKQIQRSIKDFGIDPGRLEFEITESMVMEDVQSAIGTMEKMRQLGVKLSIDDFGTGYSSLAYLKNFQIDSVKIDRSFIKELPHNQNDVAITTAILAMAERLGIKVIAEGVETQAQSQFLHEQGCHLMQGFLFARPTAVPELLGLKIEKADFLLKASPRGI
jgi:diguanylate cyclase (GGDEF)-like protein/PAS domain S-box-containing protein